jgi:hypothetical protein
VAFESGVERSMPPKGDVTDTGELANVRGESIEPRGGVEGGVAENDWVK